MPTEETLVLVKPDGVRRGLIHQVVGRIEAKGLRIVGLKMLTMSSALADKHYHAHVEKKFYPELKAFMTSGPVVAFFRAGRFSTISATAPMRSKRTSGSGSVKGHPAREVAPILRAAGDRRALHGGPWHHGTTPLEGASV